jgi:hypothetical protein
LDIGACFGLLSQQIIDRIPGASSVGIEPDEWYIDQGKAAGVTATIVNAPVHDGTLPSIVELIRLRGIQSVILRRVLRQVFWPDTSFGVRFAAAMSAAGVMEMWVQGGVRPKSPEPLTTTEQGVKLLCASGLWRLRRVSGQTLTPVAQLVRNSA